jgi:hypothetical protein
MIRRPHGELQRVPFLCLLFRLEKASYIGLGLRRLFLPLVYSMLNAVRQVVDDNLKQQVMARSLHSLRWCALDRCRILTNCVEMTVCLGVTELTYGGIRL